MGAVLPKFEFPVNVKVKLPPGKVQIFNGHLRTTNFITLSFYASEKGKKLGFSDYSFPLYPQNMMTIDGELYDSVMNNGPLSVYGAPAGMYYSPYNDSRFAVQGLSEVFDFAESVAAGTAATLAYTTAPLSAYDLLMLDFDISESSLGTSPLSAYIKAYMFGSNAIASKYAGINGFPYKAKFKGIIAAPTITIYYANGDSVDHNFKISLVHFLAGY